MEGGLWRRTWAHDRLALGLLGFGCALAAIAWRATTRPMGDTPSYRATALILRDGWPTITERVPGYPLLLVLTGASDGSSRLLFVVQLALHALSVVLVIDLARRADVGRVGRAAIAVLLLAPAVLLRVLHEGTEGLAAFLLTLIAWMALTPPRPTRRLGWALGLGALCGLAGLVRPNLAVLVVPIALVAALASGDRAPRPAGRRPVLLAAAVALPAVALIGSYSIANGVRFDAFGLTPLLPYHLSSKTAPYVEDLPASYEPARSVLIEERDAALLRGESSAPDNYIWRARDRLEEVTGLEGRALDRYVLEMDLLLIRTNPYGYLATVQDASVAYAQMDSQPAILGLGRPAAWAQQALHLVLLVAFLALASLVPGLALAGQVARHRLTIWAVALLLGAATWASAVTTETGTARLRAPSEPLLALVLVLSASLVRRAWRRRAGPSAVA